MMAVHIVIMVLKISSDIAILAVSELAALEKDLTLIAIMELTYFLSQAASQIIIVILFLRIANP